MQIILSCSLVAVSEVYAIIRLIIRLINIWSTYFGMGYTSLVMDNCSLTVVQLLNCCMVTINQSQ